MRKFWLGCFLLLLSCGGKIDTPQEFEVLTPSAEKLSILVSGLENSDQKKLAFIQHGLASDREHPVVRTAEQALIERGYVVVRFDSRYSLGKSDGTVEKARLSTFSEDLNTVVQWASGQKFYHEPFVLAGHSLGGASVLKYAAENPDKTGLVIAVAPVVSGELWEKSCMQNMPDFCREWKKNGQYVYQDEKVYGNKKAVIPYAVVEEAKSFDILKQAKNIKSNVLLIAADKDIVIPAKDVQKLYQALTNNKSVGVVSDSGHNFDKAQNQKDLYDILTAFLRK